LSQQLSIPLPIGTAVMPAPYGARCDDFTLLAPISGVSAVLERIARRAHSRRSSGAYLAAAAALAGAAGALMMTTESA
jgi:hypothetical protein